MSHLTSEQRYTISVMHKEKHTQTAIAAAIGKSKSVVCRELKRNRDQRNGEYKMLVFKLISSSSSSHSSHMED